MLTAATVIGLSSLTCTCSGPVVAEQQICSALRLVGCGFNPKLSHTKCLVPIVAPLLPTACSGDNVSNADEKQNLACFGVGQWLGLNVTLLLSGSLIGAAHVSYWKWLFAGPAVSAAIRSRQVWSVTKRLCKSYHHRPNTLIHLYLHGLPVRPRSSGGFE